jgi:hypothetical protein
LVASVVRRRFPESVEEPPRLAAAVAEEAVESAKVDVRAKL